VDSTIKMKKYDFACTAIKICDPQYAQANPLLLSKLAILKKMSKLSGIGFSWMSAVP